MRPVGGGVWMLCIWGASLGCASGKRWVHQPFHRHKQDAGIRLYDARGPSQPGVYDKTTARLGAPAKEEPVAAELPLDPKEPRPQVQLTGTPTSPSLRTVPPSDGRLLGEFRNTYYDFPAEATFVTAQGPTSASPVTLMNRSCEPIQKVDRGFFESLCVQGSGTLVNGTTVSFAKRECGCAELCPKTQQRICFDPLDPALFPWGRGAMGKAITPLSSVAVDSDVIPLGTHIYIPEYDGVERHAGGGKHNGCFVAEDRGMKVKGQHVDVFTGNPEVTRHLNALVPSNIGVHVYIDTSRCQ